MISIDVSGRHILISGASSGLGAHFAHVLAGAGARVSLCARRADRLAALCADLESAGGRAQAVDMDVADETSVIAAFETAAQAFGPVDSVIANAGMNSEGLALDLSAEEFSRVLAVNLTGAFLTAREGARQMIANDSKTREHGRIVIISSITATKVDGGIAAYSASKAGVQQMAKVLAREWANKGISVNTICPGYIETAINADWFQTEAGKKQIARWPRRRLLHMTDLDQMVALLSSDAARRMTGGVYTIDDGQSL